MGLFSRSKPKIKVQSTKKDGFSGWIQCAGCPELIHANELQQNLNCCPKCSYHYRLGLDARLSLLADEGSLCELFTDISPLDALEFVDTSKYSERLLHAQEKTGRKDAIWTGTCRLQTIETALAVLDFSFMGGSMGSVVGEKLTCLIEYAIENRLSLIIVSTSGGARMQESILSLMQMAKTSAALSRLHEAALPFLSVLTNPTTGGMTASFATLGDLIVAEPDALVAFAGPRVVEQTIKQKLPPKAQKSEFLLEKGLVDCIVPRSQLKMRLAFFLDFLVGNKAPQREIDSDPLAENRSQGLKELLMKMRDTSLPNPI